MSDSTDTKTVVVITATDVDEAPSVKGATDATDPVRSIRSLRVGKLRAQTFS